MALQILSVDGISATPTAAISMGDLKQIGGGKFRPIPCPGITSNSPPTICTDKLHLMPSARAEVWVINRDANGSIINPDDSKAVLQTTGYITGISGDAWPAIDLAQITFTGPGQSNIPKVLQINDPMHNGGSGINNIALAKDLATSNASVLPNAACKPLPKGWKRRIFYGNPTIDNFGLGFELVDDKGNQVPNSFQDVAAYPNAAKSICLPLGTGNTPVYEKWELINLANEDHNFHIHQTKFRVLTAGEILDGTSGRSSKAILQDNVPILSGTVNCDGTVASWRNGSCQTTPVVVEIPFAIAGDFVFHCHILDHEDGGMMGAINITGSAL